jgi:excinuclease ABC subunit A
MRKLKTLDAVGLGYITLGQQSTTLSGGEAQRVKLSKELSRPGTGDTLYILDEPTTGMHFEDIRHLLNVLRALVDKGNTVIVIEHNMDVIKTADHIIDLGPEGGQAGGEIVATGTPEEIAAMDTHTSGFLREELERARAFQNGDDDEDVDLDAMADDEDAETEEVAA